MVTNFDESELPEVVIDEERTKNGFTYVHVGEWHFCVEDDLEDRDGLWWNDVKSWVAYANYLDKIKAERSADSAVE